MHKRREAEVELAKGGSVLAKTTKLGITDQTYYCWRRVTEPGVEYRLPEAGRDDAPTIPGARPQRTGARFSSCSGNAKIRFQSSSMSITDQPLSSAFFRRASEKVPILESGRPRAGP